MGLLLDLGYLAAGILISPWLLFKVATDRRYRHRLGERFGCGAASPEGQTLWIHCASVGEVNLAKPLVARLRKTHPQLNFHITANTIAGAISAEPAITAPKRIRIGFRP